MGVGWEWFVNLLLRTRLQSTQFDSIQKGACNQSIDPSNPTAAARWRRYRSSGGYCCSALLLPPSKPEKLRKEFEGEGPFTCLKRDTLLYPGLFPRRSQERSAGPLALLASSFCCLWVLIKVDRSESLASRPCPSPRLCGVALGSFGRRVCAAAAKGTAGRARGTIHLPCSEGGRGGLEPGRKPSFGARAAQRAGGFHSLSIQMHPGGRALLLARACCVSLASRPVRRLGPRAARASIVD